MILSRLFFREVSAADPPSEVPTPQGVPQVKVDPVKVARMFAALRGGSNWAEEPEGAEKKGKEGGKEAGRARPEEKEPEEAKAVEEREAAVCC